MLLSFLLLIIGVVILGIGLFLLIDKYETSSKWKLAGGVILVMLALFVICAGMNPIANQLLLLLLHLVP